MTRAPSILRDRELLELLAGEPELLAIADALLETQRRRPRRRRRRWLGATAAALAAAAAAVVLLVISPWGGSPTLAERGLAAVGEGQVLHVAIEQSSGSPLLDLRTGAAIPRTLRTEIWFDERRGLKRTVTTLAGETVDEMLETPAGGWTRGGRVITCAWIAAHPAEATRTGVSCDPSGRNGTQPRRVPEQAPTLEQALAGFVDHYRSALASGAAEEAGRDTVDGVTVVWLRFSTSRGTERVAVDASTYQPVLLEWSAGERPIRIVLAETVPADAALFPRPAAAPVQTGGGVVSQTQVEPARAAAVLGGGLWLGEAWNGLSLVSVERQERAVYVGGSPPAGRVPVLKLTYARVSPDGEVDRHSRVELYEASRCLIRVGWSCSPSDPRSPDRLGAAFAPWLGLLVRDSVYVSIWRRRGAPDLLEIARALEPVP